jgi:hypothetical protein
MTNHNASNDVVKRAEYADKRHGGAMKMQTQLLTLFLFTVLTVGCTHTREVGYETSQIPPDEMFRSIRGEDVTVTLENSRELEGRIVELTPETLQLQGKHSDTLTHLPTRLVTSIYVAGSALGPIVGFLGGGVAGGFIGGEIGYSGTPEGGWRSVGAFGGAIVGALAGGIAGIVLGAGATAANEYTLPPSGMEMRTYVDTITVRVERILDETETFVTIPWYSGRTSLPKSQISIQKTTYGIYIKVPRPLLYQDNKPRYIDGHE